MSEANSNAKHWHYAEQGRSYGPFSTDEIKSLVEQGAVNMNTYVWKPGMSEWLRAWQSDLADLFAEKQAPPPPPDSQPVEQARIHPPKYLPGSIHRMWIVYAVMTIVGALFTESGQKQLYGIGSAMGFVGYVLSLVLLYRFWWTTRDTARTTPGKAVGFLFVPVFHVYWVFIAYLGLAEDMRLSCQKYGIEDCAPNKPLALVVSVLYFLGFVGFYFIIFYMLQNPGSFQEFVGDSQPSQMSFILGMTINILEIVLFKSFADTAERLLQRQAGDV